MHSQGRENLAEFIRQAILDRIASGQYCEGSRIPSVRMLMQEFSVSSQTVQRSLRLLHEDRAVMAIHGSGVYVSVRQAPVTLRLAMIFPEESISRRHLDLENWGMSSELHRGLLSEGVRYDVRLEFLHVSAESGPELWRQLSDELREHSGVVFVGHQLLGLQQLLTQHLPVFQFNNGISQSSAIIQVDYNREEALRMLLQQAFTAGCRTASCLSYLDGVNVRQDQCFLHRAEQMLQLCPACGLRPLHRHPRSIARETRGELEKMIAAEQADFMFCNHAYLVRDVHEFCRGRRHPLLLGAIGSGFTFQGLYPGMIYMRVPMFEAGQGIVRCVQQLCGRDPLAEVRAGLQQFTAELVVPDDMMCARLA